MQKKILFLFILLFTLTVSQIRGESVITSTKTITVSMGSPESITLGDSTYTLELTPTIGPAPDNDYSTTVDLRKDQVLLTNFWSPKVIYYLNEGYYLKLDSAYSPSNPNQTTLSLIKYSSSPAMSPTLLNRTGALVYLGEPQPFIVGGSTYLIGIPIVNTIADDGSVNYVVSVGGKFISLPYKFDNGYNLDLYGFQLNQEGSIPNGLKIVAYTDVPQVEGCQESANSRDYFKKGEVTHMGCPATKCEDYCLNENTVRKWTCAPNPDHPDIINPSTEDHLCSGGCIDGACQCPQLSSPSPDFCKNGSIIPQKSSDGCITGYKCVRELSNGRKAEIKIMPETASEIAIKKLGQLGFNVTLKEVGIGNETKAIYHLETIKTVKLFGFINKKAKIQLDVDAENEGKIISMNKPWWSFMAKGF